MIIQGDSLTVLRTRRAQSVQMCVTSPPYWGLRDYGVAGQIGLEATPEEYVSRMGVNYYSHLLPQKPPILINNSLVTKTCPCGVEFATRARRAKFCDACRPVHKAAAQKRANERLTIRRRQRA